MILGAKNGGSRVETRKLSFFLFIHGTGRPRATQADWAQGTEQATGMHTCTGNLCVDAIEAGISVNGPAHILHTGMGSGGLGWAKGGDEAGYVTPDWAGRMAILNRQTNWPYLREIM